MTFLAMLPWFFSVVVSDPVEGNKIIEQKEFSTFESCSYMAVKKVGELIELGYDVSAACSMNPTFKVE